MNYWVKVKCNLCGTSYQVPRSTRMMIAHTENITLKEAIAQKYSCDECLALEGFVESLLDGIGEYEYRLEVVKILLEKKGFCFSRISNERSK